MIDGEGRLSLAVAARGDWPFLFSTNDDREGTIPFVMAKNKNIELFHWVCTKCHNQNYISKRNKTKVEKEKLNGRLRYCKHCRQRTPHNLSTKMK